MAYDYTLRYYLGTSIRADGSERKAVGNFSGYSVVSTTSGEILTLNNKIVPVSIEPHPRMDEIGYAVRMAYASTDIVDENFHSLLRSGVKVILRMHGKSEQEFLGQDVTPEKIQPREVLIQDLNISRRTKGTLLSHGLRTVDHLLQVAFHNVVSDGSNSEAKTVHEAVFDYVIQFRGIGDRLAYELADRIMCMESSGELSHRQLRTHPSDWSN